MENCPTCGAVVASIFDHVDGCPSSVKVGSEAFRTATDAQRAAIRRKWMQAPDGKTWREFFDSVQPTFGMDEAVTVPWCGMWLAVETDGYTHS